MQDKSIEKLEETISIKKALLQLFFIRKQPMYIYNVTMNIDESIHKEWFLWIHKHIQDVLASGFFVSAKLTQVLVEEEMGGVTYSVQYLSLIHI